MSGAEPFFEVEIRKGRLFWVATVVGRSGNWGALSSSWIGGPSFARLSRDAAIRAAERWAERERASRRRVEVTERIQV